MLTIPVIISGGSGSRLWPASRLTHPKPFLKLADGLSLLQHTIERTTAIEGIEEIVTVTNKALASQTENDYITGNNTTVPHTLLLEPEGRDTAAAVAAATAYTMKTHGENAVMYIFPADHIITKQDAFLTAIKKATSLAQQGKIVTFGITPDHPETGFGYIEADGEKVQRFVEKPDLETAKSYLQSGRFYWNSGMFCFSAGVMYEAMQTHCPGILKTVTDSIDSASINKHNMVQHIHLAPDIFSKAQKISIDYAIMEKVSDIAVVACDIGWNDIGSWSAMIDLSSPDEQGNVIEGDVVTVATQNSYIRSHQRVVGTVGVDDLIIVDTADALLVAHKENVQKVKDIFNHLKERGDKTALDTPLVQQNWGHSLILDEGTGYQLRRLELMPGEQYDCEPSSHLTHHWTITAGAATLACNGKATMIGRGITHQVMPGMRAGLNNHTQNPILIVELQIESS